MNSKTRAVVFSAPEAPLEVTEIDLEPPKEGEVKVSIAAAGVCHSDLHVMRGEWVLPLPLVMGHEGAGIVDRDRPRRLRPRAGRPRHPLLAARLPALPPLRGRVPVPVRGRRGGHPERRPLRRHVPPLPGRRAGPPLPRRLLVRVRGGRPRDGRGQDPRRHAARARRPDRLLRRDRRRRGPAHGAGAGGRDRGRDRLRRRRPLRSPGRPPRQRRPGDRRRPTRPQARAREDIRRHRRRQRRRRRRGRGGSGSHRRRRGLRLRRDRPYIDHRAGGADARARRHGGGRGPPARRARRRGSIPSSSPSPSSGSSARTTGASGRPSTSRSSPTSTWTGASRSTS